MATGNRQRVLVVSGRDELRNELITLLSGYGYFVEFCRNRLEAARKFRAHKQHLVILDMAALRFFPKRLFEFFRRIRRHSIMLIAADKEQEHDALRHLPLGAYDVLSLPLKTDSLRQTLHRALEHHRLLLENLFVKNLVFFGLLLLPVWAGLVFVLLRGCPPPLFLRPQGIPGSGPLRGRPGNRS